MKEYLIILKNWVLDNADVVLPICAYIIVSLGVILFVLIAYRVAKPYEENIEGNKIEDNYECVNLKKDLLQKYYELRDLLDKCDDEQRRYELQELLVKYEEVFDSIKRSGKDDL